VDSARAFAAKFGINHAYGTYEELAQDKNVEIIYIGSPHPSHFNNIMLCLKHGNPLLSRVRTRAYITIYRQARTVREAFDPQPSGSH